MSLEGSEASKYVVGAYAWFYTLGIATIGWGNCVLCISALRLLGWLRGWVVGPFSSGIQELASRGAWDSRLRLQTW